MFSNTHFLHLRTHFYSHLITVPPGVSPANAILGSALMHMGGGMGNDGMGGGGGGGGGGDDFDTYGGIDPGRTGDWYLLELPLRESGFSGKQVVSFE